MADKNQQINNNPRRIMRLPQVMAATGFGRSWLYALMKRGDFPQARKIGARAVGFDSREVQSWIDARMGEQE